ncbi:MAG: RICIN domain-containing protein [Deltaproteobacteria bacterium]|nr:RICIN domain-containing protein [Deltaproteobacteria bacterium]
MNKNILQVKEYRFLKLFSSYFLVLIISLLFSGSAIALEVTGAITACHDPSRIIEEDGKFIILSTAPNINVRASTDLVNWSWEPRIYTYDSGQPPWMDSIATGIDLWAPDIIERPTGGYFVFYSRNLYPDAVREQTVCGVGTSSSIDGPFTDSGAVLNLDLYNPGYRAIDPAPIYDTSGNLWLAAGSFGAPNSDGAAWGGIRLFELNENTGKLQTPNDNGVRIAGSWIEAAFLYYHNGYYYLFFNEGRCCEGLDSTYFIRMGRSKSIAGPYLDLDDRDLNPQSSGGTLFMGLDFESNYTGQTTDAAPKANMGNIGRELGPGHAGISLLSDGFERVTYHYYDTATPGGEPTLGIKTIIWGTDGWPRVGWTLNDGVYAIGTRSTVDMDSSNALFLADENSSPILRPFDGSKNMFWKISKAEANQYTFKNHESSLALSKSGESVILTSPDGNNSNQKWFTEQTNDLSFKIESTHFSESLTGAGSNSGDGVQILSSVSNNSSQRWFITPVGAYKICSAYGGMCAACPSATGETVTVEASADTDSQAWWFVPDGDGYSKIINVKTGLAMTVKDASTLNGVKIIVSSLTKDDDQRFSADILTDGSFRLVPKISGKAIEVANASINPGASLEQWTFTHVLNQQFNLQFIATINTQSPGNITPNISDSDSMSDTGSINSSTDTNTELTAQTDSDKLSDSDTSINSNKDTENSLIETNNISNEGCGCNVTGKYKSNYSLLKLLTCIFSTM